MTAPETATNTEITIRRVDLTGADRERLAHLSALDSRAPLDGPVLGAEVEGELRAAISLRSGEFIADPFMRTSELRALLRVRAGQMREQRPRHRRLGWPALRRAPRPALGGSPPGEIDSLLRTR